MEKAIIRSVEGDAVELYCKETQFGMIYSLDEYTLKCLEEEEVHDAEYHRELRGTGWAFKNLSWFQRFALSMNRYGEKLLEIWG